MSGSDSNGRRTTMLWPLVVMVVMLGIVVGGVVVCVTALRSCEELPGRLGRDAANIVTDQIAKLAGAFRPGVRLSTVTRSALGQLSDKAKLVVLTAEVDVTITKSIHTSVLWGYVGLGTSDVRLRAEGNKVQYFIPMDRLSPDRFSFDPDPRMLTLHMPPPRLDDQMVSVQSDPSHIYYEREGTGWSQIDRMRGRFLEGEARRDLLPTVIREGLNPLLADRARENARKLLTDRLKELLRATLGPGVGVEIEFDER